MPSLAPHIGIIFVEVALTAFLDGFEGFVGAAGVGDGAVERCVPVEVVWAERTDRTNGAGGWVLKNGGEAGDASFGDGFKNDASLSEARLADGRRRCCRWEFGHKSGGSRWVSRR